MSFSMMINSGRPPITVFHCSVLMITYSRSQFTECNSTDWSYQWAELFIEELKVINYCHVLLPFVPSML